MSQPMLDRVIVAFDIETIPDPDIGRRVLALSGSDAEVVVEMARLRLEETKGQTEYPKPPWHRVVSIGATVLDRLRGSVRTYTFGASGDERNKLETFFHFVGAHPIAPRLVSWNGRGFDLPILRYRAMLHGVQVLRSMNDYYDRHGDLHLDMMDLLSIHGAQTRIGLEVVSQMLGTGGKRFVDKPVYQHILEGEHRKVDEYCRLDTVQTFLVFVAWAFHESHLDRRDVRRWVDSLRSDLEGHVDVEPGWRDIIALLARWPSWAPSSNA